MFDVRSKEIRKVINCQKQKQAVSVTWISTRSSLVPSNTPHLAMHAQLTSQFSYYIVDITSKTFRFELYLIQAIYSPHLLLNESQTENVFSRCICACVATLCTFCLVDDICVKQK